MGKYILLYYHSSVVVVVVVVVCVRPIWGTMYSNLQLSFGYKRGGRIKLYSRSTGHIATAADAWGKMGDLKLDK